MVCSKDSLIDKEAIIKDQICKIGKKMAKKLGAEYSMHRIKKETEYINDLINDLKKDNLKEDTADTGCNCCNADKALFWKDNENNAFVDRSGDILATVKDHTIRFKVKCCPNCGRNFS